MVSPTSQWVYWITRTRLGCCSIYVWRTGPRAPGDVRLSEAVANPRTVTISWRRGAAKCAKSLWSRPIWASCLAAARHLRRHLAVA